MSSPQNVNIFEDIQALCSDFRRQWKKGNQPRIEEYVSRLDEAARQNLFQNLLHVELDFRRRQHESPSSDEYIARFPQFGRWIRQAFFESTMMSIEMDAETPAEQETLVIGVPAARRLGEYELIRELGRGGFGVVYAARHLQRGETVALKTLPMGLAGSSQSLDDAERLHKFRREFRSLSEVNHPNLVGMQSLEVDGDQWFFTMDLVDGVDFLEYVRPGGKFDEDRLHATLAQLVEGIIALHDRGIVHRDLKPSNVLVTADGHAVVLDFGLVTELQSQAGHTVSLLSQHFAGTPRYAAPEQAAGTRSAAVDWYALGVMLYEALTGEAPFAGTVVQLMVKKQTEDAPRLVGRDDVPRDLAELVDRLLQREPDQRPGAAVICEAVGIAADTVSHDSTDSSLSGSSTLVETFLVGRESQLAELEQARRDLLRTKEPVVVFVRGRSGEGKTSLVEKFLEPLRRDRSLLLLSGRCYDRETVPFKAIDCIIDALVAHLRARSTDDVHSLLPSDIHILAHLFPVLRRVSAITDRTAASIIGIDSRQIRYRAFAALRELLITLGQSTPIVMFIDDLQWGDADSATALLELLQPPTAPSVMLLGSYRSDEVHESPFLRQWNASCTSHEGRSTSIKQLTVEVSSLTEDQCLSFLAARLGLARDALRQQTRDMFQAAHGNPYFLEQLMEGFDAETGQFQAVPLDEIINRKLRRLPKEAASLLEAIAVAGQAVKLDEAASVADQSSQAFATITHMRSERLVRLIGSSEQQLVDTYHDKIRETTLDGLTDAERRQLHVRFGELIESAEGVSADQMLQLLDRDVTAEELELPATERIFDLAYHFHAASDSRAFAYQLLAGELAFRAYASEDAIAFLNRASKALPSSQSPTICYRLWQRLGTSMMRAKEFQDALSTYQLAIESAPSKYATAVAHMGVASVYLTLGQFTSATESYDQALDALGKSRPRGTWAWFGSFGMLLQILCFPQNLLTWVHRRKELATARLEHLIFSNIFGYVFEQRGGSIINYPYAGLRSCIASISARTPESLALGLGDVAMLLAMNGLPGLGKRLLERRDALGAHSDDAEVQGKWKFRSAVVNANAREFRAAEVEFQRAYPLLEKSGSHSWYKVAAHLHRHLIAITSSSSEELKSANRVLRAALAAQDIQGQFMGHYDIASALARQGEIQDALEHIQESSRLLPKGEFNLTEAIFLGTVGFVRLQASDYEGARTALEKSWALMLGRKLVMEYVVRSLPYLLESIAGSDWIDGKSPLDRGRLNRLCWISKLAYYFYPNMQSPIQRARGRAFWILNKRPKADRCFEQAVKCARRLGIEYDLARSLLDLAAVKEEGRDENRAEAIELLRKTESVIPYAERWLLGEQYDEQVVAPPPNSKEEQGGALRDEAVSKEM